LHALVAAEIIDLLFDFSITLKIFVAVHMKLDGGND
jgi:hypothetical protein